MYLDNFQGGNDDDDFDQDDEVASAHDSTWEQEENMGIVSKKSEISQYTLFVTLIIVKTRKATYSFIFVITGPKRSTVQLEVE